MPPKAHLSTAVLVFALSPSEEMLHKPIPKAAELYTELTKNTIHTVEKSGLSYFHVTENEQIGATFGERFTNAIQSVFDHGYENIITIGNDSPLLQVEQIKSASLHLANRQSVMGRCADGGFYLMGIHKSQFDAIEFKKIPWQTNRTAAAVLNLIQENNKAIVQLVTLTDIDCVQDLKDIIKLQSQVSDRLIQLMLYIIGFHSYHIEYKQYEYSEVHSECIYNKGSPLLIVV
ncbi:DUF2064 domain-containing protein [Sediminicola sp. 1XM1-17]|uniref:DUF2064 domain-containing protein n=1 Tax=Sediminicola sp. 1XM1-17 TaxID=3127702 RepID=UPI003078307E